MCDRHWAENFFKICWQTTSINLSKPLKKIQESHKKHNDHLHWSGPMTWGFPTPADAINMVTIVEWWITCPLLKSMQSSYYVIIKKLDVTWQHYLCKNWPDLEVAYDPLTQELDQWEKYNIRTSSINLQVVVTFESPPQGHPACETPTNQSIAINLEFF